MRSWRLQTSLTKLLHVSFHHYWLRVPFSAPTPPPPLCLPTLLFSAPTSPLCLPTLLFSAPTSPLCPPTCCLGSGRIYPGKEMSPNWKVAAQGTRALSGGAAARSPAAVSPSTPSAAHHRPPVGGIKVGCHTQPQCLYASQVTYWAPWHVYIHMCIFSTCSVHCIRESGRIMGEITAGFPWHL